MLKELIKIANTLDAKGLSAEADTLDNIIKESAKEVVDAGKSKVQIKKEKELQEAASALRESLDGRFDPERKRWDKVPTFGEFNRMADLATRLIEAAENMRDTYHFHDMPKNPDMIPLRDYNEKTEEDAKLRGEYGDELEEDLEEAGLTEEFGELSRLFDLKEKYR
tara:strand:- start:1117 stop:1614 length:498 start_codon:yes stop_codon:yes gene_type:complete